MELDRNRTALLGLHWMNDVVSADGAVGMMYAAAIERSAVLPRVTKLFAAAREAGLTIAHTRICFKPGYADLHANGPIYHAVAQTGGLIDGQPGADTVDELRGDGDLDIPHNRVSGFANTSLDTPLRARGIDTVLLTGVATNVTVEGTGRHAADLGYRVVAVSDCMTSDTDEAHRASLANLALVAEVAGADEVLAAL